MEGHQEQIESLMRSHGFEKQEAAAWYHLERAREILNELEKEDEERTSGGGFSQTYMHIYRGTHIQNHVRTLKSFLAQRVLARHYPEGWGGGRQEEAEAEKGP